MYLGVMLSLLAAIIGFAMKRSGNPEQVGENVMLAEQEATDGLLVPLPDPVRSTAYRAVGVARYPVRAEKDPRAPRPAEVFRGSDWKSGLSHLSRHGDALVVVARMLCPHDWLDNDVYRSVIVGMDREPANAAIIAEGLDELQVKAGAAILELDRHGLRELLIEVDGTAFFRTLLKSTIAHLYDSPVVWAGCGYEGTFGCNGISQRDGINEIDWLPEPEGI